MVVSISWCVNGQLHYGIRVRNHQYLKINPKLCMRTSFMTFASIAYIDPTLKLPIFVLLFYFLRYYVDRTNREQRFDARNN